jgi:hypothetical protein
MRKSLWWIWPRLQQFWVILATFIHFHKKQQRSEWQRFGRAHQKAALVWSRFGGFVYA